MKPRLGVVLRVWLINQFVTFDKRNLSFLKFEVLLPFVNKRASRSFDCSFYKTKSIVFLIILLEGSLDLFAF